MSNKIKILLFEHKIEHDLSTKVKYSEPEIYDGNGDLSRRWYVYFSFRNPITGYLERLPNIYASNKLDKKERLDLLKIYKKNLSEMLKNGFNPFDNNETDEIATYSIEEAFKFALNLKKQTQAATTYTNYSARIARFENWLKNKGFEKRFITSINKKTINTYLNEILENTSARNRDNTRLDLSSLFQILEDNEIISSNPIAKIKPVGSVPEKNKPFTFDQEKAIFDYIKENKLEVLYLYIQHISWSFFRPVECNRLLISDIIINEKIYHIKTKTGFKIKIIPDILFNELPDLSQYNQNSYLFGFDGFGQFWEAKESNRRNHYNRLFLEIKKACGITGREYGFYSFRHTNITRLYNKFIQEMSPDEAESKLMTITQHQTKDALRKYLREINAYRPEDYSKYF